MKYLVMIILWVIALPTHASSDKNKDCEAAVDAADSMNVNQKGCDYTNEGLNGILHRAFKKNTQQATELPLITSGESNGASPKSAEVKNKLEILLADEFDQWEDSSVIRASLLPKAMDVCVQGFRILDESYKPVANQKFKLSLYIQCVE